MITIVNPGVRFNLDNPDAARENTSSILSSERTTSSGTFPPLTTLLLYIALWMCGKTGSDVRALMITPMYRDIWRKGRKNRMFCGNFCLFYSRLLRSARGIISEYSGWHMQIAPGVRYGDMDLAPGTRRRIRLHKQGRRRGRGLILRRVRVCGQ